MMTACPGICRHCGCSDARPCRLEDSEPCCWSDMRRTVCSNPRCMQAEKQRLARVISLARSRRRTPAEVHAEMLAERKAGRKRSRERRKGRAA